MRPDKVRQFAAGCRRFFAESEAATVTEYAVPFILYKVSGVRYVELVAPDIGTLLDSH